MFIGQIIKGMKMQHSALLNLCQTFFYTYAHRKLRNLAESLYYKNICVEGFRIYPVPPFAYNKKRKRLLNLLLPLFFLSLDLTMISIQNLSQRKDVFLRI